MSLLFETKLPHAIVAAHEPICKNCRFWNSPASWDENKRFCDNPRMKALVKNGALVIGEEGANTLVFPPDFGCNNFEVR